MDIHEAEQRRADNLIWNAAGDYSFAPWMRVYDDDGHAELYWNSIIGVVYAQYDSEKLLSFTDSFGRSARRPLWETVYWLGLENAVLPRATEELPALEILRNEYSRSISSREPDDDETVDILREYFCGNGSAHSELIDALHAVDGRDTESVLNQLKEILSKHLSYRPAEQKKQKTAKGFFLRLFGKDDDSLNQIAPVRGFALGKAEYYRPSADESPEEHRRSIRLPRPTSTKEIDMREYVTGYFGPSMFDVREVYALERELCTGNHADCHLHFTRGAAEDKTKVKGYAGERRRASLAQEEKNRAAYQRSYAQNRATIERLTGQIENSMLSRLDVSSVKSSAGRLNAGTVWRSTVLSDDKVFLRQQRGEAGALAVDILLDASTSQLHRQETIASQGYIIAESLTRCRIPVRVCSFCSMNGYTIVNLFRDYGETADNEKIFRYFTAGCNRDGLAIRAAAEMMLSKDAENKILIILSDAKPNDVMKVRSVGAEYREYSEKTGIDDTAAEVHRARLRGVRVVCVFTGTDDDLPAAKLIYGHGMTRIRSLTHFSDAVSSLLLDQLEEI